MNRSEMCSEKIVFITGTDTDVGKTAVSLLALRALLASGSQDVVYLKPVQTGCLHPETDSDPAFVHRFLPGGLPRNMTPAQCIHTCLPQSKAPLFAGRADFDALCSFIRSHATRHDRVLVEGAGGLLVPIDQSRTMLDLALAVRATLLVVARAGLGTINHTLLSLQAIKAAGAPCLGVVLVDPAGLTSEPDWQENARAISIFSGQPVHGCIDPVPDFAQPPPHALHILRTCLAPTHNAL